MLQAAKVKNIIQTHNSKYQEDGLVGVLAETADGKATASGEPYRKDTMTARRYLPLGAIVKVTAKQNSKVIDVRINDRGPFRTHCVS
ncbi:rare lipoprotein A [Desulfovibrionales bacterium]